MAPLSTEVVHPRAAYSRACARVVNSRRFYAMDYWAGRALVNRLEQYETLVELPADLRVEVDACLASGPRFPTSEESTSA